MEQGYSSVIPEQLKVAMALVEGRDVFAGLPTSFGKTSACLPVTFHMIIMNGGKRGGGGGGGGDIVLS